MLRKPFSYCFLFFRGYDENDMKGGVRRGWVHVTFGSWGGTDFFNSVLILVLHECLFLEIDTRNDCTTNRAVPSGMYQGGLGVVAW